MKKILVFITVLILVILMGSYFYLYQDHRDVSATTAVNTFNSNQLLDVFQDSVIENDKEILDQVILITGVATSASEYSVILDHKIFIEFDQKNYNASNYVINKNQTYTIKGRCLGYDDLLEEVRIDQAILEK
ncbi:OB-fold protein [Nonlabens sp.]|uniref:OB-fold protein n=1 Tax=Nonlabens sp. TaxID=1888209 RepID=UPI003F6A0523